MSLGERIRTRRKELGWSLRELASRSKLTASFLCDVERDRRGIGADSLLHISQAIGIPLDQLMQGSEQRSGYTVNLPPTLLQLADNADLPFRHVLVCYWSMRTIMDYRVPSKRKDLASVDWLKFYGALKPFLD